MEQLNDVINIDEQEPDILSVTEYYDIEELKTFLLESQSSVTILSLNIQSLNSKYDLFVQTLEELNEHKLQFSIICLQEAQIKPNADCNHLSLEHLEYDMVFKPYSPQCSTKGGLVIYIQNKINYNNVNIVNSFSTWEGLFLDIQLEQMNSAITIGNIYRPPRDNNNHNSLDNFMHEFKDTLGSISRRSASLIISGDFNIDLLKLNNNGKFQEYYDFMMDLRLIQSITAPTRLSLNPSLIDHFYVKANNIVSINKSGILTRKISDHMAIFASLNVIKPTPKNPKHIFKRHFSGESIEAWLNNFSTIEWTDIVNLNLDTCPTISYDEQFSCKLEELFNQYFPLNREKFNKYKHKKSKWMTTEILLKIKQRDATYKNLMRAKNSKNFGELNQILIDQNKTIKSLIRKAKVDFYHREFDKNKSDIKKTWETISDILGKSRVNKEFPRYFNINGKSITNIKDISTYFNDFFVNIGPKLASEINTNGKLRFSNYMNSINVNTRFKFKNVGENEVANIIKNLKPKYSSGYDNISTILLKLSGNALIKPLTAIINQSLHNGVFPQKLKIAKVIPIFKKEDPHLLNNYRPISLLPAISKVFEKVVHKQLQSYFSENNLFYHHQYGFREGFSTELALNEFVDRINQILDNNKIPFALYIDLSKAFDTLDHSILIHKLRHYGITNTELNWFSSYLTDRSQYVEVNGIASDMKKIQTGVPQGSILGPLLFLIYINDLYLASKFVSIMFADDTNLLSSICDFKINTHENTSDIAERINNELSKLYDWLCVNKLSLNINKTKAMVFSFKQRTLSELPKLMINNIEIENVDNTKFLGVLINRNMSWENHINCIANKLSRVNGTLCRLKNTLPSKILQMIYSALFQPHLNYGITNWGFAPESVKNRIVKLQKKAIRNVCKAKYNSHTSELFKKLKIVKFNDLLKLNCIKFLYKYENNLLPMYFKDFFKPIKSNLQRPVRIIKAPGIYDYEDSNMKYMNKYPTIHTNTISARNTLRHNLIKMLHTNSIPDNITDKIFTHSYTGLVNYSKHHYINSYKTSCTRQNCPSCNVG
jgi:hypothetical protein